VEIPKPGGGTRQLGIPTVVDRLVQQAILQVLEPILDPAFSPSSFGFCCATIWMRMAAPIGV
jgi:RNA-directed DNA polymerase